MDQRSLKRVRVTLACIASIGAIVAVVGTASAGSNLCNANRVCIYDHVDWVALLGQRAPGNGLVNVSAGANDRTSSWENKTGTNGRWYQHSNGGGFCRSMLAGRENRYVGDSVNDQLSSWATNRGC